MIQSHDNNDPVDNTGYYETTKRRKDTKAGMFVFLLFLILVAIAMLTSCKKDNKQPSDPKPEPTPVVEPWWHLSGNWECIGTDTMFTTNLKISYCCTAYNGAKAVYNLSYPIWNYGTILTVSYHYKSDTIGFSNGSSGTNYKEVYFARIK